MKSWIKSKTLWINIIAVGSIIIRSELGFTVTPLTEVAILSLINIILRVITKEEIDWSLPKLK